MYSETASANRSKRRDLFILIAIVAILLIAEVVGRLFPSNATSGYSDIINFVLVALIIGAVILIYRRHIEEIEYFVLLNEECDYASERSGEFYDLNDGDIVIKRSIGGVGSRIAVIKKGELKEVTTLETAKKYKDGGAKLIKAYHSKSEAKTALVYESMGKTFVVIIEASEKLIEVMTENAL